MVRARKAGDLYFLAAASSFDPLTSVLAIYIGSRLASS